MVAKRLLRMIEVEATVPSPVNIPSPSL